MPISRRRFLALSGGAVVLAACGKSSKHQEFTEVAPGIVSIDLAASPNPQRFAFVLIAKEGFASGAPVRVALAPPGSTPTRFVPASVQGTGLPKHRGVYAIDTTLDEAGIWRGILDHEGAQKPFVFQVKTKRVSPGTGDPAPRAASPTTTQTLGVNPICTRVPACSLHTQSLADVIGKGKPVAVMFATPARCTSRYCGPVLDMMLKQVPDFDGIDFVHVEIYQNNETDKLISTVGAWGPLTGEPWLFGVDGTGVVRSRLDGAFDESEMRSLLRGLVS